jgi:hypothetical protein
MTASGRKETNRPDQNQRVYQPRAEPVTNLIGICIVLLIIEKTHQAMDRANV